MTQRVRFVANEQDDRRRLDQVLAARVPDLSRRQARVLLDIGGVFVDGARVKVAGRAVRSGQVIEASLGGALSRATKEVGRRARAEDDAKLPPHRVVFDDADIVVVDKPTGLLTAPTPESDRSNLADVLARVYDTLYVVHRLDLGTSGLLVFAKTDLANRTLAAAFREHDVRRQYEAVVHGVFPETIERIDVPVQGRRAVTRFAILERFDPRATLVACTLETGRTHQIRLHCRHAGHPVLGDATYANERTPWDPPRMALHARKLGIAHPRTGEALDFESPWPEEIDAWLTRLRAG